MKKIWALVLIVIMVASLSACGAKKSSVTVTTDDTASGKATQTATQNTTAVKSNPAADNFIPGHSSAIPDYATISILPEIKMDDETAWLGLCPLGKDYITELEADEADVIWFRADDKLDENDKTVFACDFEGVEDGTYALVVCTSDDENVGYVVIQMNMTKKNGDLSFDLENAQLKERPKK